MTIYTFELVPNLNKMAITSIFTFKLDPKLNKINNQSTDVMCTQVCLCARVRMYVHECIVYACV